MSYTIFFLLLTAGYLFGAPIVHEFLRFRVLDCIPGDNETLSKHIIEIADLNETCVRVNVSTATSEQIYLYVLPETEMSVKIPIKTENCSSALPNLHFSLCDEPAEVNQTGAISTLEVNNGTLVEIPVEQTNSTVIPMFYTGPTVYETLHRLGEDNDDNDNNTTIIATTTHEQQSTSHSPSE